MSKFSNYFTSLEKRGSRYNSNRWYVVVIALNTASSFMMFYKLNLQRFDRETFVACPMLVLCLLILFAPLCVIYKRENRCISGDKNQNDGGQKSIKMALWNDHHLTEYFFGKCPITKNSFRGTVLLEALRTASNALCLAFFMINVILISFKVELKFPIFLNWSIFKSIIVTVSSTIALLWVVFITIDQNYGRKWTHANDIYMKNVKIEDFEGEIVYRYALTLIHLDLWARRQFASIFYNTIYLAICTKEDLRPSPILEQEFQQLVKDHFMYPEKIRSLLDELATKLNLTRILEERAD